MLVDVAEVPGWNLFVSGNLDPSPTRSLAPVAGIVDGLLIVRQARSPTTLPLKTASSHVCNLGLVGRVDL
jgi:hypothetical protein